MSDDYGKIFVYLAAVSIPVGIYLFKLYGRFQSSFTYGMRAKCPECKKTGALNKLSERIKNKRRKASSYWDTAKGGRRQIHNTTEYWETRYHCRSCGHEFTHNHEIEYRS